jgi:hypothetical protein
MAMNMPDYLPKRLSGNSARSPGSWYSNRSLDWRIRGVLSRYAHLALALGNLKILIRWFQALNRRWNVENQASLAFTPFDILLVPS